MPRRASPLQPVEYAVLGLLWLSPRHGYELASEFQVGASLASALAVGLHDLYPALKRLESRALTEGQLKPQESRPPRRVYHLTTAGREEFWRWLNQPVRRNREVRLDFVLKLYFSRQIPEHDSAGLVSAQLAACREQLERLEAEHAVASDFARLMRELRLIATRGTIAWLADHAADFARGKPVAESKVGACEV